MNSASGDKLMSALTTESMKSLDCLEKRREVAREEGREDVREEEPKRPAPAAPNGPVKLSPDGSRRANAMTSERHTGIIMRENERT